MEYEALFTKLLQHINKIIVIIIKNHKCISILTCIYNTISPNYTNTYKNNIKNDLNLKGCASMVTDFIKQRAKIMINNYTRRT